MRLGAGSAGGGLREEAALRQPGQGLAGPASGSGYAVPRHDDKPGIRHAVTTRHIRILGTRGVPAAHGGFESFAEHLAPYLVERVWQVSVYCHEDGEGPVFEDEWRGVRRVRMPVATTGATGTIVFDWQSTVHAAGEKGLVLTLGYNTAVFCALYRLKGLTNVINMDGVEWRRQKWGAVARTWFWLNDWAGCWLGNHLVAV